MTVSAGVHLGRYSLVAPLGSGAMGEVYRARNGLLQRDVAIKILHADGAFESLRKDLEFRELLEARD